ncbi:MAG: hypothetical protein AB8G77_22305 [Rhodothermales bacterium]
MEKNGTIEIVDQFQDAFARVFEDQIQQLIQDSRKEALAAAKQILRENALHNVLEAVVGSAGGNDIAESDIAIADLANSSMHSANEAVSSRAVPYEAVATVDVGTVVEKTTSSPAVVELPVKPSRIKAKPETATRSKEAGSAPPMLNDRILEEIEAIREQIRRNELLLSQIKPFVQLSKVQDE